MGPGAWAMLVSLALALGALAFVIFSLARSIVDQRSGQRSVWREFGLGLSLMILFFVTWVGHAISQWQTFTDEQRSQGESPEVGDFVSEFAASTLENWQSEFLQLFAFVTLAALFIHRGSAESKDGQERVEASLRRIEKELGTLPSSAPTEPGEEWQLPDTPLERHDELEAEEAKHAKLKEKAKARA